jgi:hypothetical protein
MNEYDLACSVEHHFRGGKLLTDDEHEAREKQRLLQFPKHERSLWCWICGFMLDPCEFPTPREGVTAFEQHMIECRKGQCEEGG